MKTEPLNLGLDDDIIRMNIGLNRQVQCNLCKIFEVYCRPYLLAYELKLFSENQNNLKNTYTDKYQSKLKVINIVRPLNSQNKQLKFEKTKMNNRLTN